MIFGGSYVDGGGVIVYGGLAFGNGGGSESVVLGSDGLPGGGRGIVWSERAGFDFENDDEEMLIYAS